MYKIYWHNFIDPDKEKYFITGYATKMRFYIQKRIQSVICPCRHYRVISDMQYPRGACAKTALLTCFVKTYS